MDNYIASYGREYEPREHEGCEGCAFDHGHADCGIAGCVNEQDYAVTWHLVPRTKTRFVYVGETASMAVACHLVRLSTEFTVTPLPDDRWEFTVRQDAVDRMPAENTKPILAPTPAPVDPTQWRENTGTIPVPEGTMVEVKHRNGDVHIDRAGMVGGYAEDWSLDWSDFDIMEWRPVVGEGVGV